MVLRRAAAASTVIILLCAYLCCSRDEADVGEAISKPIPPIAPDTVYTGQIVTVATNGAISNQGHGIEYRFDCDAEGTHDYSAWSSSDSLMTAWPRPGAYLLKAQARCGTHVAEESPWSDGTSITVKETAVSKPSSPVGPPIRKTDELGTYCTGGAVCTRGDSVEYRFNINSDGVHDTMSWSGDTCLSLAWPLAGAYVIQAQARSLIDTSSVSPWSDGISVDVRNHDPDCRILRAWCHFTPRSTDVPDSMLVDFLDDDPDTLPNGSRLRMEYEGWDNALPYMSPAPIRFQFGYRRWTIDESGRTVADKSSPWYPLQKSEDTNPMDSNPSTRDRDSTTMRINTFNYEFRVRSWDEQNKIDASPATVRFFGNFRPTIDSVVVGFYDQVTHAFRRVLFDTLYVGWTGVPGQSRGNIMNPYLVESVAGTIVKSYKFNIRAGGHDDPRDPAGSGIYGWKLLIDDPDGAAYQGLNQWIFDNPVNQFEQEIVFQIQSSVGDDIVQNPPANLGAQIVHVIARDMRNDETSLEGIRGITPQFDEMGRPIPCNCWYLAQYYFASYARRETSTRPLYLKLVR